MKGVKSEHTLGLTWLTSFKGGTSALREPKLDENRKSEGGGGEEESIPT